MADENIRVDWRLWAVFFGLTAAALVIRTQFGGAPLLNDTDDAMRLVEVRDLIGGQGWYDLVQYRLDTPYSSPMHWSRLIDAPIALLILGLTPFLGSAMAETAAAYVYPLAMLAGVFWLSARLSMQLVGREGLLPGLALPAFSLIVFGEFAPGRFDHHSAQILLLLAALSLAISALERPRHAIGAGLSTALALGIGVESLPAVAAAILAFGLVYALDGRHARALRLFGLSFAAGSVAALAATTSPSLWLKPVCDAISVVYVAAAIGVGLVFAALSLPAIQALSRTSRLSAGLAAGLALAGLLALLFPECLRGPYAAIDPWLVDNWLDRIQEAKPAFAALIGNPAYVAAVTLPPLLAAVVTATQLLRLPPAERNRWVVYAVFLGLMLIVTLIQIRGARMAMSLSVPAGAALIIAARAAYLKRPRPLSIAGLVLSWFGFAGLVIGLATAPLANGGDGGTERRQPGSTKRPAAGRTPSRRSPPGRRSASWRRSISARTFSPSPRTRWWRRPITATSAACATPSASSAPRSKRRARSSSNAASAWW